MMSVDEHGLSHCLIPRELWKCCFGTLEKRAPICSNDIISEKREVHCGLCYCMGCPRVVFKD